MWSKVLPDKRNWLDWTKTDMGIKIIIFNCGILLKSVNNNLEKNVFYFSIKQ